MLHPPDVIPKYAPDAVVGVFEGCGCASRGAAAAVALPPGMSAYTLADVAECSARSDGWVVANGRVLDITKFLSDHPGGEFAVLTCAGEDAS